MLGPSADSTSGVAVVVGGLGNAPESGGDDASTHALIRYVIWIKGHQSHVVLHRVL